MEFENVENHVRDVFGIPSERGKELYNFVKENKIQNILELGFLHGKSACYMAAALDSIDSGSIITIDLKLAKDYEPNINELLNRTRLGKYVKPTFSEVSYNWELMKLIESRTSGSSCEPLFDFCFIDGAHNWETDGFAFLLMEKLLKPNGVVLFDDLDWSYGKSPTLKDTDKVKAMPKDFKKTEQIGKVFSLLVSQHPRFEVIKNDGSWGWARKKQ